MHSLKTNFVMEGEIRKQNQLKEDNWKKKEKRMVLYYCLLKSVYSIFCPVLN